MCWLNILSLIVLHFASSGRARDRRSLCANNLIARTWCKFIISKTLMVWWFIKYSFVFIFSCSWFWWNHCVWSSAKWTHQPGCSCSRTWKVHCTFILQDTNCFGHKHTWWILCATETRRWLSSTFGETCFRCSCWFLETKPTAFFVILYFLFFRICPNNHHGKNWLQLICTIMNGILGTFSEVNTLAILL